MREFTTELFMSPQWYVARTFFEGQNEPPSTARNFVSARSNVPRPSYMRPTRWGMQASAMHRGLRMVSWLISGEVLHVQRGQLPLLPPGQLNSMNPGHAISHSRGEPTRSHADPAWRCGRLCRNEIAGRPALRSPFGVAGADGFRCHRDAQERTGQCNSPVGVCKQWFVPARS
jgi:hypothetical protein